MTPDDRAAVHMFRARNMPCTVPSPNTKQMAEFSVQKFGGPHGQT